MSQPSAPTGKGGMEFKGSAIRGSSLLNTLGDIRLVLKRGSPILIDNVSYDTSMTGDWTSNSIQLAMDYAGETNFSVTIRIPDSSASPAKKKGPSDTKAGRTQSINSTVKDLDSINAKFAARLQAEPEPQPDSKHGPVKRAGVPKQRRPKDPPPLPEEHNSGMTDQDATSLDDNGEDGYIDAYDNQGTMPEPTKPVASQARHPRKLPPLDMRRGSTGHDTLPAATSTATGNTPVSSIVPNRPKSRTGIPVSQSNPSSSARKAVHSVNSTTNTPKSHNQNPPPIQSIPKRANYRTTSSSNGDAQSETTEEAPKPVLTESALEERRRLAAERVKRKLKEDQERVEREAAQREAELKAQHEASVNKAKELQARTAARVEQYKEEKLRMEAERRAIEAYEKQQRELVNQQFLNAERFRKMKEIRREAKNRLLQIEQEEYRKAVEAAEDRQKQLYERHKKYEANTTFLPRLDGNVGQQEAGGAGKVGMDRRGLSGGRINPPGRVVKNLGAELEQLEEHSATFPEEPVLRSRSAKQSVRFQPGGAGVGEGNGNAERNKRKSAGNLTNAGAGGGVGDGAPRVLSARRTGPGAAAAMNPAIAQQRPRDEDEWSDDGPDPFLQVKQHLLPAVHSNSNPSGYGEGDFLEEDSLMQEDNDDYGRLDDEMELELFGKIQRSPVAAVRSGGAGGLKAAAVQPLNANRKAGNPVPVTPQPQQQPQQQKAGTNPRQQGRRRDGDDAASDCSELTEDSMRRGNSRTHTRTGSGRKLAQAPAHGTGGKTPVPPPTQRVGSASRLPRPVPNPQQTVPTVYVEGGPKFTLPHPTAYQPQFTGQHPAPLQQVQFASSFNKPVSDTHSTGMTPSPTRSTGKSVYRKLKPIPLSQPYRPVPNTPGVHDR